MIEESLKEFIKHFRINKFVETGTDMGETVAEVSKWFAEMSPDFGQVHDHFTTGAQSYNKWNKPIQYPVFKNAGASPFKIWSVDLDRSSYERAAENFKSNANITLVNDSSERFLTGKIAEFKKDPDARVFFFLDAHWGKFWPIRDELRAISALDRFAIAIDDFFVPGRSDVSKARGDFGFDFYHKRVLCWGYIHDCFADGSVRVFYPRVPNRDRRGWCLITRGYSAAELEFVTGTMGLEEIPAGDAGHRELLSPVFSTYLDLRIALRMVFPLSWLRRGFAITRALGLKIG